MTSGVWSTGMPFLSLQLRRRTVFGNTGNKIVEGFIPGTCGLIDTLATTVSAVYDEIGSFRGRLLKSEIKAK